MWGRASQQREQPGRAPRGAHADLTEELGEGWCGWNREKKEEVAGNEARESLQMILKRIKWRHTNAMVQTGCSQRALGKGLGKEVSAELRPRGEDLRREHSKQQGSRSSALSRDERAHGRCRVGEERGWGQRQGWWEGVLNCEGSGSHLQDFAWRHIWCHKWGSALASGGRRTGMLRTQLPASKCR